MAIHESDREDLMREAVALLRRVELKIAGNAETVICGFRRNGSLALYFGADPVYQFDAEGRLRRAFLDGLLYRTQGDTLAQLQRHRANDVTELLRQDLTGKELNQFLSSMRQTLQQFLRAIDEGKSEIIAQIPSDDAIVPDIVDTLRRIVELDGQLAPQIKGKR